MKNIYWQINKWIYIYWVAYNNYKLYNKTISLTKLWDHLHCTKGVCFGFFFSENAVIMIHCFYIKDWKYGLILSICYLHIWNLVQINRFPKIWCNLMYLWNECLLCWLPWHILHMNTVWSMTICLLSRLWRINRSSSDTWSSDRGTAARVALILETSDAI